MQRELCRGLAGYHRPSSVQAARDAIASPMCLFQRINMIKKLKGHCKVVHCATFDRNAQFVITGSGDGLVKIWSTRTGFCVRSCIGHGAAITHLALSWNNKFLASSASNDRSIRIWRIPDGLPISVLPGHGGAVTNIAFSPRRGYEHHLLSSSEDGICRIWDARDPALRPHVYMPAPRDVEPVPPRRPRSASLQVSNISSRASRVLCCAFNAAGTIFVTGTSDHLVRVWSPTKGTLKQKPNFELDTLEGHERRVYVVQFSGCGVFGRHFVPKGEYPTSFQNKSAHESIVTCSRDGSAIIWTPLHGQHNSEAGRWVKAYQMRVPPYPIHSQQRTPRGRRRWSVRKNRAINIIIWSLDSRFVVGAIPDCRVCVWNSQDGSLAHSLIGHVKQTYVLDVHPFNPQIAMSAGYDGLVIIWDIWNGHPIRTYKTGDCNLVDGHFSPDGSSLVVSDNIGQIYLFATGDGSSHRNAKYAQFFLRDYENLPGDNYGSVEREKPFSAYLNNMQDDLCDAGLIPYPYEYQSMYQQERLCAMGIKWNPSSVPHQIEIPDPCDGGPPGATGPFEPPVGSFPNIEDGFASDRYWSVDSDSSDSHSSDSDYRPSVNKIDSEQIEKTEDEEDQTNTGVMLDRRVQSEKEDPVDESTGLKTHRPRSSTNTGKSEAQTATSSSSSDKRKRHDDGDNKNVRSSPSKRMATASSSIPVKAPRAEQSRRPKRQAARRAVLRLSNVLQEEDREAEFEAICCSAVERASGSVEPQAVLQRGFREEPDSPHRAEQSTRPRRRARFHSLSDIIQDEDRKAKFLARFRSPLERTSGSVAQRGARQEAYNAPKAGGSESLYRGNIARRPRSTRKRRPYASITKAES